MRAAINRVLDLLESVYSPESETVASENIDQLIEMLEPVHDAYVEIIEEALAALTAGEIDAGHELLQIQRDQLASTLDRIGTLIEQLAESDVTALRLIVEYLFTRTRLVDELKMFPAYGLDVRDQTPNTDHNDDPGQSTINYLETVMTGKQYLYEQILQCHS